LALGAEVVAAGPTGERRIPIASFFTGPFATALKPDEILVEIRVPIPPAHSGGAYLKLERKVGDFATAAVAVQLTLAASGACDQVGIGLTSVGPQPSRPRGRRQPSRATGRTTPPSSAPPSSPPRRPSPARISAGRSSTSRRREVRARVLVLPISDVTASGRGGIMRAFLGPRVLSGNEA